MWIAIYRGDDSKFLNHVSLCCFQTSFRETALCVLLEDKQKGNSEEVDRPWILPTFSPGL